MSCEMFEWLGLTAEQARAFTASIRPRLMRPAAAAAAAAAAGPGPGLPSLYRGNSDHAPARLFSETDTPPPKDSVMLDTLDPDRAPPPDAPGTHSEDGVYREYMRFYTRMALLARLADEAAAQHCPPQRTKQALARALRAESRRFVAMCAQMQGDDLLRLAGSLAKDVRVSDVRYSAAYDVFGTADLSAGLAMTTGPGAMARLQGPRRHDWRPYFRAGRTVLTRPQFLAFVASAWDRVDWVREYTPCSPWLNDDAYFDARSPSWLDAALQREDEAAGLLPRRAGDIEDAGLRVCALEVTATERLCRPFHMGFVTFMEASRPCYVSMVRAITATRIGRYVMNGYTVIPPCMRALLADRVLPLQESDALPPVWRYEERCMVGRMFQGHRTFSLDDVLAFATAVLSRHGRDKLARRLEAVRAFASGRDGHRSAPVGCRAVQRCGMCPVESELKTESRRTCLESLKMQVVDRAVSISRASRTSSIGEVYYHPDVAPAAAGYPEPAPAEIAMRMAQVDASSHEVLTRLERERAPSAGGSSSLPRCPPPSG